MRVILIFIFLFIGVQLSFAQIPMGDWRLFTPPGNARDITASSTHVYVALENGLLEREINSSEKYVWTAANYLSDIDLSAIHFDSNSGTLFVGYANGNLDLIKNNSVLNLPALLLANLSGNKRYNKFASKDGLVYAATGIGIIKLDPIKSEVRDSYFPFSSTVPILDVAFIGDTIFALSSNSIRYGNKNNIALADYTQWSTLPNVPSHAQGSFKELVVYQNKLVLTYQHPDYQEDTIYVRETNEFEPIPELNNNQIYGITPYNDHLIFSADGSVINLDANFQVIENIFQYNTGEFVQGNRAIKIGLDYWIADRIYGMVKARNSYSHEKIGFPGPHENDYYSMAWESGKLAVAGGGLIGNQASYNLAGLYLFEDENWSGINAFNQPQMSEDTWDVISVSIDPNDTEHIAFGTYSLRPLFEVTNGTSVATWFDENNSPLEKTTLGNNLYSVPELFFDNNSNLWVGQSYSNFPLKVKTSDNVWYEFDLGPTPKAKVINDLQIDFNGIKWLAPQGAGVMVFDDNGTIEDLSDDRFKQLKMGEGLGNLPSNSVRSICVDFNNDIWFGTELGLAILYNSSNIFDGSPGTFDAQQILIEIDGFVEILLGESVITKIVIDGGNRKWIGTEASGVFLLSPDGREEIYRFTAENSPLISNQILDIEIDDNTGEVFFATDKGLISFRSDATFGDPEFTNVTVFPNPVRPEFTGPVTIQGIGYESDVKITDSGGNLVYKTISNGGTATWNGMTLQGERAKSGVYLIWTASSEGKGRKVGKVVFIN